MQDLAVEPIELVPVEARPSFVDTIEVKHCRRIVQRESFLHPLGNGPTQQRHVVGNGFRCVAHFAKLIDGRHPIPLGQFSSLGIEDQRCMGKRWQGQIQSCVKQQLFGGVGDVIFTADHMGDVHGGVIHHHHKVVERISDLIERCPTGNNHVAAKVGPAPAHGAPHEVFPADFSIVVDTKADHRFASFRLEGRFLIGREVAVAVVVARSLVCGLLVLAHGLQFAFAGVAAISQAAIEKRLDGLAVLGDSLALDHRLFIPVDAKPLQAFKDVLGVFRLRSLLVGVFDAQQKTAVLVAGK